MIPLLFVLFVALPQAAGLPSADAPPATAEMSGRITDLETGQPIPRAVVHLTKVPDGQPVVTLTDEDGRWQLTGLSPGTRYNIFANAQNANNTPIGSVLSFTTLATPSVTTLAATNVATPTATQNG